MTPRVGVDVAAIPRLADAHRRFGERFLRKFLSDREIAYCGGSVERWAGRWAAKEAIGKAMPTGVPRPSMRDVEILPSDDGRPHVRVAPATTLSAIRARTPRERSCTSSASPTTATSPSRSP